MSNITMIKGSAASRIRLKEIAFDLLKGDLSSTQVSRILELSSLRSNKLILESDYYLGIIEAVDPSLLTSY